MKFRRKFLLTGFFLLFIFFTLSFGKALAVNTGTIGILPAYPDPAVRFSASWFIYNLDKGKSKEDAVRIINNQDQPVVIKLYAVDATNTTDGSFAMLPEDAERKDVGNWVKLALNQIEVPAKSEKIVPFTFTVPQDTDVGDHMGGIVMQQVEGDVNNLSGTGVKIITRVGVRIYQTVPGQPTKSFNIERFDSRTVVNEKAGFFKKIIGLNKKTLFFIGIGNNGNVKISPQVKVSITNIFGRKVGDVPAGDIGDVFPGTHTTDSMVTWDGMPFFGRYTAKLSVIFPGQDMNEGTKELVFWAVPYRLIAILAGLIVITIFLRLFIQYAKESLKENMPIYTVKQNDTIGRLAELFQVKWKKLISVNELKKPFDVSVGQRLFVPVRDSNYEQIGKLYRQGMLELPIKKDAVGPGKSRKKIIIGVIVLFVLIGGGFAYYKIKKNDYNKKNQLFQPVENVVEQKNEDNENDDLTSSGAEKKSSIEVSVCTLAGTEWESSARLQDKFQLSGYKSKLLPTLCEKEYLNTTIEYSADRKVQAELVKNDMGIGARVDMIEAAQVGNVIVVNNKADKNEFIRIEGKAGEASAIRELIKVVLLKDGNTSDEKIIKLKDLIYQGGYDVADDFQQAEGINSVGLTILYSKDEDLPKAESLKDYLSKNDYKTSLKKQALQDNQEVVVSIVVSL